MAASRISGARREVGPPGEGDGLDEKILPHCREGLGEGQVGVVVGEEKAGLGPVDQKEDPAGRSPAAHAGQLLQMPPPPLRDRVGKHGDRPAHEGAGLDLQVKGPAVPLQEKIEAAVPHLHLCPGERRLFQAGDLLRLEQRGGDGVVCVRMEEQGDSLPFDGHRRVGQGALTRPAVSGTR